MAKFYGVTILGLGVPAFTRAGTYPGDDPDYRSWMNLRMSTIDSFLVNGSDGLEETVWMDCLAKDNETFSGLINILSLRVDPLSGSSEFGRMMCQVQVNDRYSAGVGVDALLSYTDGRDATFSGHISRFLSLSKPRRWGRLFGGSGIEQTDYPNFSGFSTIYAQKYSGRRDLQVGQFIYSGREVFQVLEFSDTPGSGMPAQAKYSIKIRRGACGSIQESHFASDYSDVELFTDNPVVISRDVQVWELDTDDFSESLIFQGQLEKPITDSTLGCIKLSAVGSLVQANNYRPGSKRAYWSWDLQARREGSRQLAPIHTRGIPIKSLQESDADMVVVRGGAVIPISFNRLPGSSNGLLRYQIDKEFPPIMGTFEDDKQNKDSGVAASMKEVIVAVPGFTHFYNPEDSQALTHPFDILRCLLCSRYGDGKNGYYDLLPKGWGLGYPNELIDHDSIDALKTPELGYWFYGPNLSIPSFMIGHEDSSFRDIIERILKPLLCFLTYTSEGKLTIKPFIDPGPSGVMYSFDSGDFVWSGSETSQDFVIFDPRKEIRYKIARRGASNEYGGELLASTTRQDIGDRFLGFATDEEVDALDYGRPEVSSTSWLDTPSLRALQQLTTLRWEITNYALHQYRLMVQTSNNIQPGDVVSITHPGLYDPVTGQNGIEQARCIVMGVDLDPHTHDRELTLVNLGVTFQQDELVAPMWKIAIVHASESIEIEPDEFTSDDSIYFVGTLKLTIYDPDTLEPLEGTYGSVSGTISGEMITLVEAFDTTPSIGQLIGPTIWTERDSLNNTFAHIADDDGEFSDEETGHQWGY